MSIPLVRRWHAAGIPFVQQLASADCGAACLAMVLGYFGKTVGLDELNATTGMTARGISAEALLDAGGRHGLAGRPVRLETNQLHHLARGAILYWGFRHFVVFDRVTPRGVRIVDPAIGVREVSMAVVGEQFTGIALEFVPTAEFAPATARKRPWRHLSAVASEWQRLAFVLTLSLLAQALALSVPLATQLAVDALGPDGGHSLDTLLPIGLAGVVVFDFLVGWMRGALTVQVRALLDVRFSLQFVDHLLRLPFSYFQARSTGDLMNRVNSNAMVRELLTSGTLSAALDGSFAVLFLVLLFAGSWPMALATLLLAALRVLVFVSARRRQHELLAANLEKDSAARNFEVEMFTGVQTLKAMGLERQAVQRWFGLYAEMMNVSIRRWKSIAWTDAAANTLGLAGPVLVLLLGAHEVRRGHLTLGQMFALSALATAFLGPIGNLVNAAFQFQQAGVYLARIDEVMQAAPERVAQASVPAPVLSGAVEIEQVTFRYGAYLPPVLQQASLKVEAGQFIAIVGRSGAGKSTLAQMLLGLHEPGAGRVRFDGVDLCEIDLTALRRQIGIVLQTPALFRGDIRNNIALGDPSMALERVERAARIAQIHDEILRMPMGYETVLSEMGASMSGGQRQRIALARAIAHEPAILLLDEATNALDSPTERAVYAALSELSCTRIVIAHRLSTIIDADVIYVVADGRIVEQGRHGDLLALEGHYHALHTA